MNKNKFSKIFLCLFVLSFLAGCARDLSNSMYVSDSTTNFTLEGKIISVRPVTIRDSDRLQGNSTGLATGALVGGVAGSNVGGGSGKVAGAVGGAVLGGLVGAAMQDSLSTSKGLEYTVRVDVFNIKDTYYEGTAALRNIIAAARVNSGLLTIVQSEKDPLHKGQKVFIVFSDNRTRVIPAE
jgi:outer membrane lipoprotein SlyB